MDRMNRNNDPSRDLATELGDNLKMYREDLGKTITQVSEDIRMSREYIYRIERGEANPTIGILEKLARHYGMELDVMFTYRGERV